METYKYAAVLWLEYGSRRMWASQKDPWNLRIALSEKKKGEGQQGRERKTESESKRKTDRVGEKEKDRERQ